MVQRQFESLKNVDFIGDIHGYADELKELLRKLGYEKRQRIYQHPQGRKVVFLGDYVDRGSKIIETLELVKSMTDNGSAYALLGNHEYNLITFFNKDKKGNYLRRHSINKIYQVLESMAEFKGRKKELDNYLQWILRLPVFIENSYFRAVHATWNRWAMSVLESELVNNQLSDLERLIQSTQKGTSFFYALNIAIKGLELKLPKGMFFEVGDYVKRPSVRVKWWADSIDQSSYRKIAVHENEQIPDIAVNTRNLKFTNFLYSREGKPVFFGHYWMQKEPKILKPNVCCLDYSIAKEHKLVAYRFNGEQILDNKNLVWVDCCV